MTAEDYIKRKSENINKKIDQDARIAAKTTFKGSTSLIKSTAEFSKDVAKEICPNCTIYFTIGGVVFLLIIVLFYFK